MGFFQYENVPHERCLTLEHKGVVQKIPLMMTNLLSGVSGGEVVEVNTRVIPSLKAEVLLGVTILRKKDSGRTDNWRRLKGLSFLVLGMMLGSSGAYFVLRVPSNRWMPLTRDGQGLLWLNDVVFADIPFPNMTPIEGQAKFVDRGAGRGTELGYAVHTAMDKLDVSKLPEKYKKTEDYGNYSIGPTSVVVYTAHLEFTLKDADGFTLMTTQSEPIKIWSGEDNKLQGFANDSIPDATVKRTKKVLMSLGFDKCETCK